MSFMQKLRIKTDNQPIPTREKKFLFAPRWLAENQRTVLRVVGFVAIVSLGLNGYQFYLREQLPEKPPETFAALFDSNMTEIRVVNTKQLTVSDAEMAAKAVVRRLVSQLRQIESTRGVQDNIDTLYCTTTGNAATKANNSFERGATATLQKKGAKRTLNREKVWVEKEPGVVWRDDGTILTAKWMETVQEGLREEQIQMTAQFKVQRYLHVDNKIRNCNVLAIMVTDYELED